MQKFSELYEAVKPKTVKIKYVGPYTRGGQSDFPSVVLEMAGVQFKASAIAAQGSHRHPTAKTIERPNKIGIDIGSRTIFIDNVEPLFVQAKLWSYRDPTSINRNAHSYPVMDKDTSSAKESTTAWNALKKIIVAEVQKLFTTDEDAARTWNNNNVPANKIPTPGSTDVISVADKPKTIKPKPVSKTQSSVGVSKWLSDVAKGANVKLNVSGTNDSATIRYASSDVIAKNKLKSEIEDMGAQTTRASNSSVAVYELDDMVIKFGYESMTVKRK